MAEEERQCRGEKKKKKKTQRRQKDDSCGQYQSALGLHLEVLLGWQLVPARRSRRRGISLEDRRRSKEERLAIALGSTKLWGSMKKCCWDGSLYLQEEAKEEGSVQVREEEELRRRGGAQHTGPEREVIQQQKKKEGGGERPVKTAVMLAVPLECTEASCRNCCWGGSLYLHGIRAGESRGRRATVSTGQGRMRKK